MDTKNRILELFENNKGEYFSGEAIAEKLCITRTAVWKAVKSLRKDGYDISATPNKGYSLSTDTDIISAQGIIKYLDPICKNVNIDVYPTLTSTNITAREKADGGAKEGFVVIANSQTGGKGRNGRFFHSPLGTGLYMSIVLRPHTHASNAVHLTTMAAVAVCEAIESMGVKAEIKWVNDIFVNGKKVCGILTEAAIGIENGSMEYAIVGIGVNISQPEGGFPAEIKNIAGAVFSEPQSDGKNRLAAEILSRFMHLYYSCDDTSYVDRYRAHSFVIGKEITVIKHMGQKKAIALDIDDQCHLIVKYEDGGIEKLSSGEISIRLS